MVETMKLLRVSQAAKKLGWSRWTLLRACRAGDVPAVRRGAWWYVDLDLITADALERAAARRTAVEPEPTPPTRRKRAA